MLRKVLVITFYLVILIAGPIAFSLLCKIGLGEVKLEEFDRVLKIAKISATITWLSMAGLVINRILLFYKDKNSK